MGTGAVLVTGASGTVGAAVAHELRRTGETVRAGSHGRAPTSAGDLVEFDFSRPETWPGAFEGVDRLFLVRPPAISDVKTYLRPVIRFAGEHEVRHVVFLSVMGVNRLLPHWQVERDIEDAGLAHTFVRPAFFAQNLLTAYRSDIVDHDRIRLASGSGRTSFVDTRDVARVAADVLRKPVGHDGKAYTLTGPHALSYYQVASLLSAALGRSIDYQPIGLLRYRSELTSAGHETAYVNVQLVINAVAALGQAGGVTPTLGSLLGHPPTTVAQFVHDHVAAWR